MSTDGINFCEYVVVLVEFCGLFEGLSYRPIPNRIVRGPDFPERVKCWDMVSTFAIQTSEFRLRVDLQIADY